MTLRPEDLRTITLTIGLLYFYLGLKGESLLIFKHSKQPNCSQTENYEPITV